MYIKGQNQVDMAKHLKKFTDFQVTEPLIKKVSLHSSIFAEKDMIRPWRQNLQREHEFLYDWQEKASKRRAISNSEGTRRSYAKDEKRK